MYAREYDYMKDTAELDSREMLVRFILRFGRVVRAATGYSIADHIRDLRDLPVENLVRLAALTRDRVRQVTEIPPRDPSPFPAKT